MSTTTLNLGAAQLTVETEALFRAWLEQNLGIAHPDATLPTHPAPNEGERYVGTIIRVDGSGHHIYRMPIERGKEMKWDKALDYAAEKGGELPDRVESALLFATRDAGEFEHEWYWTREQHAGDVAYAWCQFFDDGDQSYDLKLNEHRVVLVRRVAIQTFSH